MAALDWEMLDVVERRLAVLAEKARRLRTPTPAAGRELASLLTQEVVIRDGDLTPKTGLFYNGDIHDIVISRLTAFVSLQATATPRLRLTRTPLSWGAGSGAGVLFDFAWNYTLGSTGARYCRDFSVSSRVLGIPAQQKYLEFTSPLVVKQADTLTFEVTPLVFGAQAPSTDSFVVTFVGIGYRREPA